MSWGTVLNTAVNLYGQYQNQQNQNTDQFAGSNATGSTTTAASNQGGWAKLLQTAANAYIAYNNSKNQQDGYNAQLAASKEPQVQTRSPYANNIISAMAPMIMQQQMQNYNDAVKRMGGKGFSGDMSTNPLMQMMTQMMQNPNMIGGTSQFGGQQGTPLSSLTQEQRDRIAANLGGGAALGGRLGADRPDIDRGIGVGGDLGLNRGINQQDLGLISDAQSRYNATLGDNPSMMDRMGLQMYNVLPGSGNQWGSRAYAALTGGWNGRLPGLAPQTDEQKAIWGSIPQFNSRYADFQVERGNSGNDVIDRMGYTNMGFLY